MTALTLAMRRYDAAAELLSGCIPEGLALLFVRIAFGGIFWRSGQTKVVAGSWFTLTEAARELFRSEYAGVPLPPSLAAPLANAAEHLLPILLLIGLFTRISALGLLAMTLVIQILVYPEAWWPEHSLWVALALMLIVRGGGMFSVDGLLVGSR